MENEVKVYMMGAAAVVVSGVKLEDWKLVEQYAPEALRIMDENGEPVFRVMTKKGSGSMNRYGVVWGSYLSEEGNATVTMLLDEDVENPKEAVMEVIGSALLALAGIEKALPGVIEEICEKQKRIEKQITRV